jgi:hypothetical protein
LTREGRRSLENGRAMTSGGLPVKEEPLPGFVPVTLVETTWRPPPCLLPGPVHRIRQGHSANTVRGARERKVHPRDPPYLAFRGDSWRGATGVIPPDNPTR